MSAGGLEFLIIALLAGEPVLELPNLVITGQFSAERPVRIFWPMPDEPEREWMDDAGPGMPTITRGDTESRHLPVHSPVPAGFSISVAAGPRTSGNLIAGIAEPRGGVSVWAWSSSGERMERTGIRGSALTGGSWGSIGIRLERWEDRYEERDLAPDWLCGDITLRLPIRRGQQATLVTYTTSAESDDIHVRAGYNGGLNSQSTFSIFGGDREAGGQISWRHPSGRLRLGGGGVWARINEEDTSWLVGNGSILLATLGKGSLEISGRRSLTLERRERLRNQFPLLGIEQDAMLTALEWEGRVEGRYRIAPNVDLSLAAGSRSMAAAPSWLRLENDQWNAVSLAGEGVFGFLTGQWRFDGGYDIRGVLSMDALSTTGDDDTRTTDHWPLRPRATWSLEARRQGGIDLRCRILGRHDMVTYDGEPIPAEVIVSWQALLPMGGGWQIWTVGSLGDSWDYSPTPNRMATVGISWSTRGLLK